jgi:cell division protein FtsN
VSDEGFREIQLNGKQLIFLFMAVTVVLVVTFLFGVLVGRGVREGVGTGAIASNEIVSDPGLAPAADNAPPPSPAAGAATPAPSAQPAEELSYAERLLRDTAPEETLKPATPQAAPAPVVQEPVSQKAAAPPPVPAPPPPAKERTPAPAPKETVTAPAPKERTPVAAATPAAPPASAPAAASAGPASDPSGPGIAVQVAAYRDRKDADTLAKQLAAKGYPAFVMDPVKGTSTTLFRVRVGKYKTLKDAEAIQAKLQSAEQLTNAWIAR